jgi:hypothetical protein
MLQIEKLLVEVVYVFITVLDPSTVRLLVTIVPVTVALSARIVPTVMFGLPLRLEARLALDAKIAEWATPVNAPKKVLAVTVEDPALIAPELMVPMVMLGVPVNPRALEAMIAEWATPVSVPKKVLAVTVEEPALIAPELMVPTVMLGVPANPRALEAMIAE